MISSLSRGEKSKESFSIGNHQSRGHKCSTSGLDLSLIREMDSAAISRKAILSCIYSLIALVLNVTRYTFSISKVFQPCDFVSHGHHTRGSNPE